MILRRLALWWGHIRRNAASQVFAITYLAYATLYATRKPFSVVKTRVQQDLDITTRTLGLIDTAFLAAYAVGQIIIPGLLARSPFTSSALLMLLYVGSGICSILFGLATFPPSLAILWVLNGALHSGVFPILVGCVSPFFPPHKRGLVMGTWTTSQQVGATVSTVFSAYVSAHASWRWVFILPGIATVGFAYFLRLALTSFHTPVAEPIVSPSCSKSKQSSPARTAVEELELVDAPRENGARRSNDLEVNAKEEGHATMNVFKIQDIASVSLCYLCVKYVRYSLLFWLPYYLATQLGYSSDMAGYASIVFDVGGILGGVACGQTADYCCRGRRILVACGASIVCTAALLLFAWATTAHAVMIVPLMALVGFAVAGSDSIIGGSAPADLCDRASVPSMLSTATGGQVRSDQHFFAGVVNGVGSVGAVVQAYVTAYISEKWGWGITFELLAFVSLLGAILLIQPLIHERSPRNQAGPF